MKRNLPLALFALLLLSIGSTATAQSYGPRGGSSTTVTIQHNPQQGGYMPRGAYNDQNYYCGQNNYPNNYQHPQRVWVDGYWQMHPQSGRVWVPGHWEYPRPTPPPPAQPVVYAGMNPCQFQSALAQLSNISFDNSRLAVAQEIAASNMLTSDQVRQMLLTFAFDNSKLDFARYAYTRTVDPQNYYIVNSAFTFESSIVQLQQYINGCPRNW